MVAVADMFEIGPISSSFSSVPLHIVLVVSGGPGWKTNRLQTIWGDNIGHDNIKFACLRIVVVNGNLTLWLRASNLCLSRTCTLQLTCIIHKIEVNIILTQGVLVVAIADMFEIGPISSSFSGVPLHVVLVVSNRPSRQVNGLKTIWGNNIRHNNIKFTCLWIVVLNGDLALRLFDLCCCQGTLCSRSWLRQLVRSITFF